MDEEQHYDKFSTEADFEDGQWIGGEFFSSGRKHRRQQTADDRLYGVFADGSDSDNDRRGKKKGGGRGNEADYSFPVGFVSSGVVNKPEDQDSAPHGAYDVQGPPTQEEGSTAPGLGSSRAPSGHGGLGFRSAGTRQQDSDAGRGDEEGDDEGDDGVLSTALGARIKKKVEEKRREEQQERQVEKKRIEARAADPQFASFEKHSKGIGMKLLMKMGFKPGEGLGKDKAGMAKPIEVKLRPKGQALGFGVRHRDDEWDEEKSSRAKGSDAGPGQRPDPQAPQRGRMWKKKHQDARVRREYRTADEVVRESSELRPEAVLAAQPILDMRGTHARLVTNLAHLNHAQGDEDQGAGADKTPMPELQYNLKLLVDMCEADIQRMDAKLRHEQDTATLLARDRERLELEERHQLEEQRRLQQVLAMVERCQDAAPPPPPAQQQQEALPRGAMSLGEVEEVYAELASSYREEYMMYGLAAVAAAQVLPRLVVSLWGWQPLLEPTRATSDFKRWRPLLESSGARGPLMQSASSEDPYLALVSELVLPPLRSAMTTWEPRDPEPLLAFLDAWERLLPSGALGHVLEMLVLPRLRKACGEWEPRQETVPVHSWLHPWLPHLGTQLEELYPGIRHKLAVALQAWHPSDGSALALLRPWQRVFSPADWEAMLLKSIVPKLAFALQQMVIDPTAQDMSPFTWLVSWSEVMPLQQTVTLLEHGFFPKWHQVLLYWLSHTPNYDEVTRWYLGWKSCFPPQVLDHERIRHQFNMALDSMNSSVEGGGQASRWSAGGHSTATAAPPLPTMPPPPQSSITYATPASELTLRDLVQQFAEEHGVPFVPKFGRFHDGLQVYSFAGISVVLENTTSVVRAQLRDRWAPVALETLLQQAKLLM